MTREQIIKYQAESVMRAKLPPVPKHSQNQTKAKQPKRAAA
ncbi:hypothetical protein NMD07_11700 [Citrobacter cronae]|uniref:Uncharacterized protein n=1 Tax=Citrobacter portucalensis TaxID=1639133 RepID=A0AAW9ES87_9ENTR|nr:MULTISPECIES: hypothetical protein [Citrobacter freundii complex]MBJ9293450.1 hypothetical protein [Citrobacter werkmanii]MBY6246211.1 hypothetical protein [Citrobacter werkmanii]MBY6254448.1 hypothetical protein [Citrobacter werkmanii]MDX7149474.1 hypothetical protein [Citrobacter portucalensis]